MERYSVISHLGYLLLLMIKTMMAGLLLLMDIILPSLVHCVPAILNMPTWADLMEFLMARLILSMKWLSETHKRQLSYMVSTSLQAGKVLICLLSSRAQVCPALIS